VAELQFFRKASKQWSDFRTFVRANETAVWKLTCFVITAFLFIAAAWNRFSLPQTPLADGDLGYLWPALMRLSGQGFAHIQGLNFLYPSLIYLILRIWGDFRAISVIQHLLGLAAGALFLASWSRLGCFLAKPRLSWVIHEAMGIWGAAIYLLSNTPVLFEMQIRSDAVCMFFEMLVFWLALQFLYYRVISLNTWRATIYGAAALINAFVLASLKPSFALFALFSGTLVIWLTLTTKGNVAGKIAFFGIAVPIIVALTLMEHHLRRDDLTVKIFLPETLFVIHANIIHAQMAADLKNGSTSVYSNEWLRGACDDLKAEIERTRNLNSEKFPVLGFEPEKLRSGGGDPLLKRWRRELGDDQYLNFLKYWYWHSMANQPLAFFQKVIRQLGVFYSIKCPAFNFYKDLPLASWAYAGSLSTLSRPQSLHLLLALPAGTDFLERTKKLRFTNIVVHQNRRVRTWNIWCGRSYLALLLISVPLAAWFLLKRSGSEALKWPAFLVIYLYSANFGNVFGISVIHSMEVWRYSAVQFIAALFAQLWAARFLIEIRLIAIGSMKSRVPRTLRENSANRRLL